MRVRVEQCNSHCTLHNPQILCSTQLGTLRYLWVARGNMVQNVKANEISLPWTGIEPRAYQWCSASNHIIKARSTEWHMLVIYLIETNILNKGKPVWSQMQIYWYYGQIIVGPLFYMVFRWAYLLPMVTVPGKQPQKSIFPCMRSAPQNNVEHLISLFLLW